MIRNADNTAPAQDTATECDGCAQLRVTVDRLGDVIEALSDELAELQKRATEDSVTREKIQWLRDLGEVQQTEINGLRMELDAMNERLRRLEAQLLITGAPTPRIRNDWGA